MLTYLLVRLADAYSMIIFIYVMMSWLPNTQSGIIGDIYRAPIIALLVLQFGVRLLVMIF